MDQRGRRLSGTKTLTGAGMGGQTRSGLGAVGGRSAKKKLRRSDENGGESYHRRTWPYSKVWTKIRSEEDEGL